MTLGLGRQARGQMDDAFADIFMRIAREYDKALGRALGVFLDHLAHLCLHVRLKRFSNVDLFAADLVPHDPSFG
jgi:hypothetical protein